MIGRTFGHYRVVEPLGSGGMGEVYRARDEKLDRDVALKVLPKGAVADEDARRRFRREAKALSRLSHPHIASIFDFDTEDGIDYLVMELVPGQSLRDELAVKGALPEKTVIQLGAQIGRGLQAAHEQGVIHRDLKPANLQLTPDGLVKILDFGLARLARGTTPVGDSEPTETVAGRVAGTLAYMSPEQLRGRDVDERTDLYALGAVLYEMATGRRLFNKASNAELTGAILYETPTPPREENDRISPGLERLLLKSLDKDQELRYQTAKDFLIDLERIHLRSEGPMRVGQPEPRASGLWTRGWVSMVTAALATVAAGGWLLWPPPPPRVTEIRPLRLDVGPEFGGPFFPTWATDGVRLYYAARSPDGTHRLYQAALTGGEPSEIPTPFNMLEVWGYLPRESALVVLGHLPEDSLPTTTAASPVWLVPLPQGPPRELGGLRANWVAISSDGERLALLDGQRLLLARSDGSEVREVLELPQRAFARWIRWSPDGTRLRYDGAGPLGDEGRSWIWETTPGGVDPVPLWPGRRGEWTRDGRYFVFDAWNPLARRRDLFAVDEGRRLPWTSREPVQITHGPLELTVPGPRPGSDGLLAFGVSRHGVPHVVDRREGRLRPVLGGESVDIVVPSRDGEWIAWATYPEGELWRSRPDGSEREQLTGGPEHAWMPRWSPDGSRIVFVGEHPNAPGRSVRLVAADGGAVETLKQAEAGSSYWDPCWLPDGRTVLFSDKTSAHPGIFRVDVETKIVSDFDGAEEMLYPKCGPQGQILAVRGSSGGPFMLYRPDTGSWETLDTETFGFASWTRDGQAFCGLRGDQRQLRCYSPATGQVDVIADLGDSPMLFGSAGWPWVGLDANDNPIVILDRSTRDFYALDWEAP